MSINNKILKPFGLSKSQVYRDKEQTLIMQQQYIR